MTSTENNYIVFDSDGNLIESESIKVDSVKLYYFRKNKNGNTTSIQEDVKVEIVHAGPEPEKVENPGESRSVTLSENNPESKEAEQVETEEIDKEILKNNFDDDSNDKLKTAKKFLGFIIDNTNNDNLFGSASDKKLNIWYYEKIIEKSNLEEEKNKLNLLTIQDLKFEIK